MRDSTTSDIPPQYVLTDLEKKLMNALQDILVYGQKRRWTTKIDGQRIRRVKKIRGKR